MWQTIPELGTGLLLASLVSAGFAFFLAVLSTARPHLLEAARRATYGTTALIGTAVAALAYAFVTHDFRLSYVARYSDRSMSFGYLLSALWGGQDGSLLWWMFLLAVYSAACIYWLRGRYLALQPYVIATLLSVIVFFGLVTLFAADPFTVSLAGAPVDGRGLNPLLQNFYMIVHPPALYLGFVGCTIPFAFAVAALISGRLDNEWIIAVRKWMLFAWLFLSLGNALGMIWAYVELGWGGYWAWDPVENSSLLPWFTATAYIHSTMIQERRPMFKLWNVILISLTFFLTIFGTFLTRSGIIASVHAFAKSDLGTYFLYYLFLLIAVTAALITWRIPKLRPQSQIESLSSREAVFVTNNWAFAAATVFVLVATTLPLISEAILEQTATVGPEFYNRWMTPIGLAIFALMGLAPLFGWRKTSTRAFQRGFIFPVTLSLCVAILHVAVGSRWNLPAFVQSDTPGPAFLAYLGRIVPVLTSSLAAFNIAVILQEFWRGTAARRSQAKENPLASFFRAIAKARRRYGGYVVHLGITFMFVGFLGQSWDVSAQASLSPGQTFQIQNYVLHYDRVRVETDVSKEMHFADFIVTDQHGRRRGVVSPAKFVYRSHSEQPTSEVGVLHSLRDDLYVVLGNLSKPSGRASIQVYVNPLVSWIWLGVVVLIFGAIISLWPSVSGRTKSSPKASSPMAPARNDAHVP
jgi:cytochrome c-type biogenesis protein CcmF